MKAFWWALKYAWLTIKHKWFVAMAGISLRVPIWRLVIHDLSKFGPSELFAYGRQFFGDKGDPEGFEKAWLHHQNVNLHHWEYWVSRSGHNRGAVSGNDYHEPSPIPMPETYIREMIADWMGASKAYTGGWQMGEWLSKNLWRMNLHPDTYRIVQFLIPITGAGYLLEKPMHFVKEAGDE